MTNTSTMINQTPLRPTRKRAARTTKSGKRYPAISAAQKQRWQDPEQRQKMLDAMAAKRAEQAEDRKLNPKKYTRQGVPDGCRRPEAEKAWAAARVAADAIMDGLKASGAMPAVVVPDSDDEK